MKYFFTINSDVKPWETSYGKSSVIHADQIFLYWKIMWKKKLIKKTLSHLAGLAHLSRFIWAGALVYFSYEHIIFFYKSFLKTMISHLGETAHLTGPVKPLRKHLKQKFNIRTSEWAKEFRNRSFSVKFRSKL